MELSANIEINTVNTLNLARLSGAVFRCDACGTHKTETRDIITGAGVSIEIIRIVTELSGGAGRAVLVSGKNSFFAAGKKISDILTGAGFFCDTVIIENLTAAQKSILAAVKDDTRLIISVGGGAITDCAKLAAAEAGLPLAVVLSTPASENFAAPYAYVDNDGFTDRREAPPPAAVIADLDILGAVPASHIAAAFGLVTSKILSVFDSRFSRVMNGTPHCDGIESLICSASDACFGLGESLTRHERKAIAALSENIIRLSLLKQMAPSQIMASGGAEGHFALSAAQILTAGSRRPRMYGENAFLGAQVLAKLYKLMLASGDGGVLPPPDMTLRAERYSAATGIPEHAVLSRYSGVPDSEAYSLYAYKFGEYRSEFYDMVCNAETRISRASRIFKRIYSDAGYWCKSYLSESDYRAAISLAPDVFEQYTLLRYMRDTGHLEQFLP